MFRCINIIYYHYGLLNELVTVFKVIPTLRRMTRARHRSLYVYIHASTHTAECDYYWLTRGVTYATVLNV